MRELLQRTINIFPAVYNHNQRTTQMHKMKAMKTTTAMLLAVAAISVTSQAQTTNWVADPFDTANQVTNSPNWGNWFGNMYQSRAWDPTMDSGNNPGSGALLVNVIAGRPAHDQYVLWPGLPWNVDMYNLFTNVSFDICYQTGSAIRTNVTVSDNYSTGIGSLDYGVMRVGAWDNWNQDWFYTFAIPATNGLGLPNTNWTHISIPININGVLKQYPNLYTLRNIMFSMDNANYGNAILSGAQTYWIDNITFIGPSNGIVHPPPSLNPVLKTKPALRVFTGAASIYARSQLTSVNANESWIGGTYPVTYSFNLLDFPNINNVQAHLEIIPGPAYTGNPGADYNNTNCLWLQILSNGSGGYTANISWKTNSTSNNPNHNELSISSASSPAGTWTLTFNSATTGTLSGPGNNNVAFTINDPNVVADFGNPATLVVGNQPNGSTAGEGQPSDYASITVTGTAAPIADDFTTASSLDAVWTTANCDNPNSVVLVTPNQPYWIYWDTPDSGYGLGVSTNVDVGPWMLPQYYNGYYTVPQIIKNGKYNWALIPSSCLPTIDGQAQSGQALSPNAFFRLSNPPPAN